MNLGSPMMAYGARIPTPKPFLDLDTRTRLMDVDVGSRLAADSSRLAVIRKAPRTRPNHKKVRMSVLMLSLNYMVLQPGQGNGDGVGGKDGEVEIGKLTTASAGLRQIALLSRSGCFAFGIWYQIIEIAYPACCMGCTLILTSVNCR